MSSAAAARVRSSSSKRAIFSPQKHSAEHSPRKGYFKTMDRKQFGS